MTLDAILLEHKVGSAEKQLGTTPADEAPSVSEPRVRLSIC